MFPPTDQIKRKGGVWVAKDSIPDTGVASRDLAKPCNQGATLQRNQAQRVATDNGGNAFY